MIAPLCEREACCGSSVEEYHPREQKANCEKRDASHNRWARRLGTRVMVSHRPIFQCTAISVPHNPSSHDGLWHSALNQRSFENIWAWYVCRRGAVKNHFYVGFCAVAMTDYTAAKSTMFATCEPLAWLRELFIQLKLVLVSALRMSMLPIRIRSD